MNISGRKINIDRKGFVLPFATLVIVVLLIMGLSLIRLGMSARVLSARTLAKISARTAADAGIAEAVRLMDEKLAAEGTWNNDNLPASVSNVALPNSDASFSYTITGDPTNGFLVTSIGKSGVAQKTVYCKLGVKSSWFGIGVKEGVDVKLGATFTKNPPDAYFAIRTNSIEDNAVALKAGIVIPGDVIVGPGGVPDNVVDTKASTVIEGGDPYTASEKIRFDPVVLPVDLAAAPLQTYTYTPSTPIIGSVDANNPAIIKYDQMNIPQAGVQEIVGHCKMYIVGDTILGQSAELIITPNSSLTLYLGDDMEAKNSNGLENQTMDATALIIYGLDSCEQIDLKAKGDVFFGKVYAPEADLDVYAKNELAGAFTGKSFNLKSSTNFTFIAELTPASIDDAGAYFGRRWWED